MAKISLNKPTSGYNLVAINENFSRIEQEFQDRVLYRNNGSGETNTIVNDIDFNSYNILNLGKINGVPFSTITNLQVIATQAQASADLALTYQTGAQLAKTQADADVVLTQGYATNSQSSAIAAATSASTAATYSSMGLGGAAAFDLGSITDLIIVFPTNWGTVP